MAFLYMVLFVIRLFGIQVPDPALVPAKPVVTIPTTTTTVAPEPTIASYDHRWDAVANCEEGGWGNYGFPNYPDSLGINATNWYAHNGGSDLSPANQARVGAEIEAAGGVPGFVPDQNGCSSW